MHSRIYLKLILLIAIVISATGCLEASFDLAPESRLPNWFEIPEGKSRNDFNVRMDYYGGINSGEAIFRLYEKNRYISLKKVTGILREKRPRKLKNSLLDFRKIIPYMKLLLSMA